MAIPRFKNCCLCFDAKTGAVILGLLGLIAGLFNLTTDSVGLGYYAPEIENMLDEYIQKSMQEFEDKGKCTSLICEINLYDINEIVYFLIQSENFMHKYYLEHRQYNNDSIRSEKKFHF